MKVEVTGSKGNRTVTCPDTDVGKDQKKVKLDWEMVTPDWEILGLHGLNDLEFTEKKKNGIDYKCTDKNSEEKDYPYTIIVGNTKTKEVILLDPTIKNGGHS
jgi:hypothetical protein